MAEPAGFDVEIVPVDVQMQRNQHYDVFMLEHDYVGAFALGFSLNDPWIRDFKTSHNLPYFSTTILLEIRPPLM